MLKQDLLTKDEKINRSDALVYVEERDFDLAAVLMRLGEFGPYYRRMLISTVTLLTLINSCFILMPFVFLQPTFYCKAADGAISLCNQVKACNNEFGYETRAPYLSVIIKQKIYCDKRWMQETGQSIIFFGSSLLSMIFCFVFNKIGRLPLFKVSFGLSIVFSLILLVSDNYWLIVCCFTIFFTIYFNTFNNFYVYTTEVFLGKWKSIATSLLIFGVGVTKLLCIGLYYIFPDYYTCFILFTLINLSIVPLCYYFVETPFFLYNKGDIDGLRKNLKYINKENNKSDIELITQNDLYIDTMIDSIPEKKESGVIEKSGKSDLIQLSIHIIIIALCIIPHYFLLGLVETIPAKLGINNVYLSSILFAITTTFTCLPMNFVLHKIPRRNGSIFFNGISFLVCMCFLFFSSKQAQESFVSDWIQMILALIAFGLGYVEFLILCRYVSEVFPIQHRITSIVIIMAIGRNGSVFAGYIDELSEKLDIHTFVFVGITYLLILPLLFFFKETINNKSSD